ncbi:unnamed protein product, partial [Mesorhabditis belari]|uniref:Bicarbonate transporter-like transmembrane domain-containing protein n=1 Tax=Mesorhabditis belari TaxID=2138241 RepID=A0AAF3J7G6_9BILA
MNGVIVHRTENFPTKEIHHDARSIRDLKNAKSLTSIRFLDSPTSLQNVAAQICRELSKEQDGFPSHDELLSNLITTNEYPHFKNAVKNFNHDPELTIGYAEHIGLQRRRVFIYKVPTLDQQIFEYFVVVYTPFKQKYTKTAEETAKTFASLFVSETLRRRFNEAKNEEEGFMILENEETIYSSGSEIFEERHSNGPWYPGKGIISDLRLRLHYYKSDFTDAFSDRRSVEKCLSTTIFLLFTILPTSIAYGMLNEENTGSVVNVSKVILGQWIGGLFFGIFGGQQLLIMTTSAPLSIYIHVLFNIAHLNHWDFWQLFACVGIWCQIFLFFYAIFEASAIMRHMKRSTEELFSLFISTTFVYKGIRAMYDVYKNNVNCLENGQQGCDTASVLIFIGSVLLCWRLATAFSNFRNKTILTDSFRETISDYALPISVLFAALVTQILFFDVHQTTFHSSTTSDAHWIEFWKLPLKGHLVAIGLSFPLSILFFVDQLLVTNTVDNKQNSLKKGSSHNWDFLVVAVLNVALSVFGIPWMHAGLPQSFLHFKALADVGKDATQREVIQKVRETRIPVLSAHLLMIPFYFFLPKIAHLMPISLFYGLFLFMAISSLTGHEFFERICLFFTEQAHYPRRDYITKVDQRTIHKFTFCQLLQLGVLLIVGMAPVNYVRMTFPLVIFMFIPIRMFILPMFFSQRDLELVDGAH